MKFQGDILNFGDFIQVFVFTSYHHLNTPKDLDPSYKMDLDVWDCFGRKQEMLQYVTNAPEGPL